MNEEIFTSYLADLFSRRTDVFEGIGDDAAVLDLKLSDGKLLLIAADQVISGIHYLPETPARQVAEKLLKRNISDIAAMGGYPTHAVLTLSLNPLDESWMREFHKALEDCAVEYGLSVVGGDISSGPEKSQIWSLTILGMVEKNKLCLRRNAKPGDLLYATGTFGNSFESQWHLLFEPRVKAAAFLAGTYTNTMMDVSDGLLKDLCRMAEASGCAVRLTEPEKRLPLRTGALWQSALTDGEDYELIFAVDPGIADKLEQDWPFKDLPLTRIGEFLPGKPGFLENKLESVKIGYDHFHEN